MIENLSNNFPNLYFNAAKNSVQKSGITEKSLPKQNNVIPYYSGFKQAQALKAQIFFTGDVERSRRLIDIAQGALDGMSNLRSEDNPVSCDWYKSFKDLLVNKNAYCYIDEIVKNRLEEKKGEFTLLKDTLGAMIGATKYKPIINDGMYYTLIHNPIIAENLKPYYSSSDFNKLFVELCDKDKKVFNLKIDDKTGLAQTAVIDSNEDLHMSESRWVTDTCRNIAIMKDKNPEECAKALKTLAKYYKKQDKVFDNIIKGKCKYNEDNGLGHIFNPKNLETCSAYNRTRLESPGLYLNTVCDAIKEGLADGKEWGFQSPDDVNGDVIFSIVNIAKYLKTINYPKASSCGNWEENTLPDGITSDTEIINNGLRKLRDLLSDKYKDVDALSNVREEIIKGLSHKKNYKEASAEVRDTLNKLIAKGEKRVRDNHLEEAPGVRKADASLAFVTHTAILDENPVKDVEENLRILDLLDEELVGVNGMRRYTGDRYENLNFEIGLNWHGEITGRKMNLYPHIARELNMEAQKATDTHEAQWFMVSDMSKGYGVQLKKLLDLVEKKKNKGKKLSSEEIDSIRTKYKKELDLIKETYQKETEFINRSYARITGDKSGTNPLIKANGKECPEFKIPESYMAVSTLYLTNPYNHGLKDRMKKRTYLPGTNTPLAWAQSSLYDASKLFKENLERMEELDRQGIIKLKEFQKIEIDPVKKEYLINSIYS